MLCITQSWFLTYNDNKALLLTYELNVDNENFFDILHDSNVIFFKTHKVDNKDFSESFDQSVDDEDCLGCLYDHSPR